MRNSIRVMAYIAILFCLRASAQSTLVSAGPIVDTDSLTWINGTYRISFVPNPSYPGPYVWSGGNLQQNSLFTGPLSNLGSFTSISIPDNTTITPSGSAWQFQVCPLATSGCVSVTQPVSGSTASLTTALNAVALGPRFSANPIAYGYGTVEVNPTPKPGAGFFNVTNNAYYNWNGFSWQESGLPSGCLIGGVVPIVCGGTGATTQLGANGTLGIPGPVFNIVNYGASPTASASTNATAIQATVNAAIAAGGGTIYTPCGTYQINAQINTWNAVSNENAGLIFQGAGMGCAVWDYVGATNVNATLWISPSSSPTSGQYLANVTVRDMSFTGNQYVTVAPLYVTNYSQDFFQNLQGGTANSSTAASVYFQGSEYSTYINIVAGAENFNSNMGPTPYYGVVIDCYVGGAQSGPNTITGLVAESGYNIGFYNKCASQTTGTGLQLSGNIMNMKTDTGAIDDTWSGLLESSSATTTSNLLVNGSVSQHFLNASITGNATNNPNVHITAAAVGTEFHQGSLYGLPVVIDSGTHSTVLDHVEIYNVNAPTITDNATDTYMHDFWDAFGDPSFGSVPTSCRTLALPGGFSGIGVRLAEVSLEFSSAGETPICFGNVGAPSTWSIYFDGLWQQSSTQPIHQEINSTNNTLTIGTATITFSISGGLLQAISSISGNTLFQGRITFVPGTLSPTSAQFEGQLVAPSSETGIINGVYHPAYCLTAAPAPSWCSSAANMNTAFNAAYAAGIAAGLTTVPIDIDPGTYNIHNSSAICVCTSGKFVVVHSPGAILNYVDTSGIAITLASGNSNQNQNVWYDLTLETGLNAATTGLSNGTSGGSASYFTRLAHPVIYGFQTQIANYTNGLEIDEPNLSMCSTIGSSTNLLLAGSADNTKIIGGQLSGSGICVNNIAVTVANPLWIVDTVIEKSTSYDYATTTNPTLWATNVHWVNSAANGNLIISSTGAAGINLQNNFIEDDSATGSVTSPITMTAGYLNVTGLHVYSAGETYSELVALSGTASAQFNTYYSPQSLTLFSNGGTGAVYQCGGTINGTAQPCTFPLLQLTKIYSAAGTALPTCNTAAKGTEAVVSDATTPTFLGSYTSGGAVVSPVLCNGSGWVTY